MRRLTLAAVAVMSVVGCVPAPDYHGGQTEDADAFTDVVHESQVLAAYDTNGDGRITCAEARSAGIAPVYEGEPAYPFMFDRDDDGMVCESGEPTPAAPSALALYDDNGDGRITCAEARAHGIALVHRGHLAYEHMRDSDGDGMVCE